MKIRYRDAKNIPEEKKKILIQKINEKIFEAENFCMCKICGYSVFLDDDLRRSIFNHIKNKHHHVKGSLFSFIKNPVSNGIGQKQKFLVRRLEGVKA